jgi:hypothetical protein
MAIGATMDFGCAVKNFARGHLSRNLRRRCFDLRGYVEVVATLNNFALCCSYTGHLQLRK